MSFAFPRPVSSETQESPTLPEALRFRAEERPAATAFRFVGERLERQQVLTYAELDRRARIVARELLRLGASGGRALLLHPPGIDYIAALFGCFYARVVAVPAYPPGAGRPMQRLSSIVEDAHASLALTTERALESIKPLTETESGLAKLQWVASDLLNGDPAANADLAIPKLSDLALLQYTSGSTSAPKGVMVTHQNFVHNILGLATRAGMNSADRVVAWLPPYHDMGLVGAILLPLYIGVESILMAPTTFLKRPNLWLDAITRLGGTVSGGPNFGFELCVRRLKPEQRAEIDLSAWRVAFSGAERVSPETLDRFAEAFRASGFDARSFAPCYGLAESTLGVSFCVPEEPAPVRAYDARALTAGRAEPAADGQSATRLVGCGPALDGVVIRIVDPETELELPDRRVGEIWVQSQSVAAGYWNQPEASDGTFRAKLSGNADDDFLRTGDLGFLDAGHLFVTGRIKDVVILGGVNYYPEDIETTVASSHPVLQGAVAAFSVDVGSEERLVVVCETPPRRDGSDDEIVRVVRKAVADRLEISIHDVRLVRAGALPRTSSGKLQRGLCKKLYSTGQL